jgi:hypothetical protein
VPVFIGAETWNVKREGPVGQECTSHEVFTLYVSPAIALVFLWCLSGKPGV